LVGAMVLSGCKTDPVVGVPEKMKQPAARSLLTPTPDQNSQLKRAVGTPIFTSEQLTLQAQTPNPPVYGAPIETLSPEMEAGMPLQGVNRQKIEVADSLGTATPTPLSENQRAIPSWTKVAQTRTPSPNLHFRRPEDYAAMDACFFNYMAAVKMANSPGSPKPEEPACLNEDINTGPIMPYPDDLRDMAEFDYKTDALGKGLIEDLDTGNIMEFTGDCFASQDSAGYIIVTAKNGDVMRFPSLGLKRVCENGQWQFQTMGDFISEYATLAYCPNGNFNDGRAMMYLQSLSDSPPVRGADGVLYKCVKNDPNNTIGKWTPDTR
jgi:hypothetical protein